MLTASGALQALDIGCGTGKVAVLLAARGLRVIAVEPDLDMARIARGHGVAVEIARFEDWNNRGRRFGLVTCGQSWQWLDPSICIPKIAGLLRPGGTLARVWNYHVFDDSILVELDAIYDRLAPELAVPGHDPRLAGEPGDPLANDARFADVRSETKRWKATYSTEHWVGFLSSLTDHQRLGRLRLAGLLTAVGAVIDSGGGRLVSQSATYVRLATRSDS